ncbi:hypothetical protein [Nonomuraea sp. KM90]
MAWSVDTARRNGVISFHAPARALYEKLGCTALPVAFYYHRLSAPAPPRA